VDIAWVQHLLPYGPQEEYPIASQHAMPPTAQSMHVPLLYWNPSWVRVPDDWSGETIMTGYPNYSGTYLLMSLIPEYANRVDITAVSEY
jgi:hypothetical protein